MSQQNNVDKRERNTKLNRLKEIFTLENAIKYYKKFSEDNPYTCTWVDGLEGNFILDLKPMPII